MNYSADRTGVTAKRRDKSGTQRRRKSAITDGTFVHDLRARGYFGFRRRRGALVGVLPLNLPTSLTYKTPKQWRDSGDDVRGLFFHQALKLSAEALGLTRRGFTLRLSTDIEKLARSQGKHCVALMHDRVGLYLRRALRGPTGFQTNLWWFSIEEAENGALHLHGEIAFRADDLKAVRKALRGAGGKWIVQRRDGVRQRSPWQLRFEADPDFGWAGYCLKNVRKAEQGWRRFMRRYGSPRRWVVGFEGKAVTASSSLKSRAFELHAKGVDIVKTLRGDD